MEDQIRHGESVISKLFDIIKLTEFDIIQAKNFLHTKMRFSYLTFDDQQIIIQVKKDIAQMNSDKYITIQNNMSNSRMMNECIASLDIIMKKIEQYENDLASISRVQNELNLDSLTSQYDWLESQIQILYLN